MIPEDALWGLFHGIRGIPGDIPAPIKELPQFEAYRAAERILQRVIAQRFGLPAELPGAPSKLTERCPK